jgi:hypothetical protein
VSGYLQRLFDRAAPVPPGAPDAMPAMPTASPVAAQDQRLHDPSLAAAIPPLPGADDDVQEPALDASDPLGQEMPGAAPPAADPVRRPVTDHDPAASRESFHTIERHVVSPTEPSWRITERTVMPTPPPASRGGEAPAERSAERSRSQDDMPPPNAPPPVTRSPAPDARPERRSETPAPLPGDESGRLEALAPQTPEQQARVTPAMPALQPPPYPEPRAAVREAEAAIPSAQAPIDIEPPPLPPPTLPSAVADSPEAEEPPRPTGQRPPVIERAVEPVRETPPAPRRQVTADSVSVIGSLARRRRTTTLFGLRRR